MASRYYDNSDQAQRFQPGTTVRADEVDAKLDRIAAGFEEAERDIDRSIKLPASEAGYELNATPLQRRRRVIGFDSDGNLTLAQGFSWRGNWATNTEFFLNDVFRDSVSKNLYVVTARHTSSQLSKDIAAGSVNLAISVQEVEEAKNSAQEARDNAKRWAEAPTGQAVEPGRYSSRHHASRSSESALASAASARSSAEARDKAKAWSEAEEGAAVEPNQFSAKHHARKSAASAAVSSSSAQASASARDKSALWANAPVDDPVEPGRYSARHHRSKAEAAQAASEAAQRKAENASEIAAGDFEKSINDHKNEANPHPQYLLEDGLFSWNGQRFSAVQVYDARALDADGGRTSYLPAPNDMPDRALTALFSTGLPGNSWRSALIMSGWNDGYTSWMLTGPSGTGVDEDYYLTSGREGKWGPDRKIWHDGNSDPENAENLTKGTIPAARIASTVRRDHTKSGTVLDARAMSDHVNSGDHDGQYVLEETPQASGLISDLLGKLASYWHWSGGRPSDAPGSRGQGVGLHIGGRTGVLDIHAEGTDSLVNIKMRTGAASEGPYHDWVDVFHTGNFNPNNYGALGTANKWAGGTQMFRSPIAYEGANGAYARSDARDTGNSTRVHSYSVIPGSGGAYAFLQAWYGGSSYTNVTTTNDGVEFDKALTTTELKLPSGVSLQGVTNGLEISRSSGWVEIGNRNSGYTHYHSSAGNHYFYGKLHSQSGFYGDGSNLTGVDADKLSGATLTSNPDPSTVAQRSSSGDISARLFRSNYDIMNDSIAAIYTTRSTSGDYMRPSTPARVRAAMGLPPYATSSRTSSSTDHLLLAKAMNDHRTSSDHDSRYYTKSEVDNLAKMQSDFRRVGAYIIAKVRDYGDVVNAGETIEGSKIHGVTPTGETFYKSFEGTWMAMSASEYADRPYTGLFLRIA